MMSLVAGLLSVRITDTLSCIPVTHLWIGVYTRLSVPVDPGLSVTYLYTLLLAKDLIQIGIQHILVQ